jgi:ABC-type multidrug transport system fused ATPase/permease subunit
LLDLIFALREPGGGRIILDGVDLGHLSLDSLRQQAMLVRGTEVLPCSIFANVAMGTDASADAVREALAAAGVLHAVDTLPDGMRTVLSPSGRPLAPSQALRLTFARAMLHKPRLLLIDEALDSIEDLSPDGPIARTLFASDAPWTLIVATERPDLWPLCDRVYTMQDGALQSTPAHSGEVAAC